VFFVQHNQGVGEATSIPAEDPRYPSPAEDEILPMGGPPISKYIDPKPIGSMVLVYMLTLGVY